MRKKLIILIVFLLTWLNLFENDNEVEKKFLILREKLSSDFEGVVPEVMDVEKGHMRNEA